MPALSFVTLWKIHFIFVFAAFVQGDLHSVCAQVVLKHRYFSTEMKEVPLSKLIKTYL